MPNGIITTETVTPKVKEQGFPRPKKKRPRKKR